MMGLLHYSTIKGKPEIKIHLENNIYFPGEIINGSFILKSGNCLSKGIIIYDVYGYGKINEEIRYKIEYNNTTKIYIYL